MTRILSASLSTLMMLASASPLLAHNQVSVATTAQSTANAVGPVLPFACPGKNLRTAGEFKLCNDTKKQQLQFTPLLDSLR